MFDVLGDPAFLIPYALAQAALFLWLIHFLDIYEREPAGALAFMALWGATGAAALTLTIGRWVLDRFDGLEGVQEAMVAALVEEPAKGVALVVAFAASQLVSRRTGSLGFEGVSDGLVYGAAVGLGFAFTEDVAFLLREATIEEGLAVFARRADFLGLNMLGHVVYTGTFGAALGAATWERSWISRVLLAIIGMGAAVAMHAAHNGLVAAGEGTLRRLVDYLFVVFFFGAIAWWVSHQHSVIRDQLAEERDAGLISHEEWEDVPRYVRTMKRHLRLARAGRMSELRIEKAVHHELVELAFAKWRLHKLGARGRSDSLEQRRNAIRLLRSA